MDNKILRRSERAAARLQPALMHRLQRASRRARLTVSEFLRRLIEEATK